jgi:hypothetical protein
MLLLPLLLLLLLVLLLLALLLVSGAESTAGVVSVQVQPSRWPVSFRVRHCIKLWLVLAKLLALPLSAMPLPLLLISVADLT